MWKHISAELQEKHVGRIHPNLCRPIYLTVPRTTPKWEDQNGELHTYAFELEPMNHDKDPWAVYVRDYNRIRNKALTTMVVDKKADESASKEHGYDKNAPKPMKPLICSYEDAEEMLAITLEDGVARRMLSTSLPRRGSDLHISDCLNKCLVEYATKTKQLYKDLFFHIAACEMTIYCAKQQTPVWSTENLMSQDPQQNRPEPDVNTFFPRGKHSAFNHNLELQEITYQLTHVSREHLRYQLLITSLTTYISAIISTQESILHHVCQAFDKVLDGNYPKQRNNEPIKPPENETIINLRMCLAGLNYYAASKARNSIQTGIQRSYFNVVCQAKIRNGIPFPILTELLGFNLSISTEQQIKLDELIERQKNIRTQVSTYNTQVHGRSENEREAYTPTATSVTPTVSAEDAALAALANRDNKRKLTNSYQQVTFPQSTLTNDIVIQYPSTYAHDVTGTELQDTKAPRRGNGAQDIDQQRCTTTVPPGQRIRSHRNSRFRAKRRRRQGEIPPPRRSNVPYDAERARRDKLRRKAERKAKWEKEEERRSEMKAQARKSPSPTRHTSQWDNRKPQEEEKKRSPTRPPRGPNTYKKTYNTGSADRMHRNSKDY